MAVEETYSTVAEVDTYATDNGRTSWSGLSDDAKLRAIVDATKDIEVYHQQINFDDTLWLSSSTDPEENLVKANNIQAIYIGENQQYRDLSKRISAIADGSYNAGGISVRGGAKRIIDPDAKLLIDRTLRRWGVRKNAFFRA